MFISTIFKIYITSGVTTAIPQPFFFHSFQQIWEYVSFIMCNHSFALDLALESFSAFGTLH